MSEPQTEPAPDVFPSGPEVFELNILENQTPEVPRVELEGFAEGVFFGMRDDTYHAMRALSNTGIKNLLISPMDFWARSWMAPVKEYEDSEAKLIGRAYHSRIVEGSVAFYRSYAPKLDLADHKGVLRTMDDLKEALRQHGQKVGGAKDELIARLLMVEPRAKIWDRIVEDYAALHADKTLLDGDLIKRIEIAAAMIERHPLLCKAFTGGMPEVTICWYDAETGVPMKIRIDYLKPRAMVDLKTFANKRGMSIDRAIAFAMAERKYHIQAAVYTEGVLQLPRLIRAGHVAGTVSAEFLDAVSTATDQQFMFVFQQKGIAPLAKGKILPRNLTFDIGVTAMREGQRRFLECLKHFGTDPWIDNSGIDVFDDSDFPQFISE